MAVFQALPFAATMKEDDGGIVVLHGGLPGAESPHRQSLVEIALIDRAQPGLDTVCGVVEPFTDRRAVSDILWSDPDPDTTAQGVRPLQHNDCMFEVSCSRLTKSLF